jgi:hypothetical protein
MNREIFMNDPEQIRNTQNIGKLGLFSPRLLIFCCDPLEARHSCLDTRYFDS